MLAQADAAGADTTMRVVAAEASIPRRAITLTGMEQLLPMFATRAAALAGDDPR